MQSHPSNRRAARGAHTLALSLILALALTPLIETADAAQTPTPTLATVQHKLASTSVPWVPNAGQWDARAAFRAQSFAGSVWVTTDGKLVHQFNGARSNVAADATARANVGADLAALSGRREARPSPRLPKSVRGDVSSVRGEPVDPRSPGWVLTERFVGGAIKQAPRGSDPHIGRVSFMTSGTLAQAGNLHSYGQVELGEVFPGVSVALKATNANVEKLFTVAPGRDPSVIRMAVDGAKRLSIGSDGSLVAKTGNGDIAFTAPIAFQEIDGARKDIPVAYHLVGPDATTAHYAFTLGDYDRTRPLTIDPLLASTYLGGGGNEQAYDLAIHPSSGEIYVVGSTISTDLPGTAGGAQPANGTGRDAFVTRFNAALTTRLQSTYLGGSGTDSARALAIHPNSGQVYVVGNTFSADLPGTVGGAQPTIGGTSADAFVTRFNATLTIRLQSTYLGGTGFEEAQSIAIHPVLGEVYVAGATNSGNMPGMLGGAQATKGALYDAFVARFNSTLTSLIQSTHLGGNGDDFANALAIHPASGQVYIAGSTESSDLPGTAGGAQTTKNVGSDAFVARFNSTLTSRLQSSYYGGGAGDAAASLVIHPISGDVYLGGGTESANLPGVAGGAQPATGGGSSDAFVTRFNAALNNYLQSTYLGGSNYDEVTSLAIRPSSGEVLAAGRTYSSDLPGIAGGAQGATSGWIVNSFVTRLNAALTFRLQSTYLGQSGDTYALALAVHPATGEVYAAGQTNASDLPGAANGAQASKNAGDDAFVSRLSVDLTSVNRVPNPVAFIHQSHVPSGSIRRSNEVRLEITPNPGNNQQAVYLSGAPGSEMCVTNTPRCCGELASSCPSGGFTTGWIPGTSPYNFLSGDYLAVRHTSASPSGTAETLAIVSGVAIPFRTSTGNANIACNLDMNGDDVISHTVEGLILVRAMLGLSGGAVVQETGISQVEWDTGLRPAINQHCGTNFKSP